MTRRSEVDAAPAGHRAAPVFICYRRADASASAGRLYDHLIGVFGKDQVFFDVEAVAPGEDFLAAIDRTLGAVDAVVVVIGPTWASLKDPDGNRLLDKPRDVVLMELALALRRQVRVIPVLVDGAVMPSADDLPEQVRGISRLNALELRHTRFAADIGRLIEALSEGPADVTQRKWPLRRRPRQSGRGVIVAAAEGKWLLWLTASQTLATIAALGATVLLQYQLFYATMWVFLLLGVNGVFVALVAGRSGRGSVARFGWISGVVSTVIWGCGLLFPLSLGLASKIQSRGFELGFRAFVLAYGVAVLFLGIGALAEIRRVR